MPEGFWSVELPIVPPSAREAMVVGFWCKATKSVPPESMVTLYVFPPPLFGTPFGVQSVGTLQLAVPPFQTELIVLARTPMAPPTKRQRGHQ
jgi:hypothetical protein